jgi:hypothetical protein
MSEDLGTGTQSVPNAPHSISRLASHCCLSRSGSGPWVPGRSSSNRSRESDSAVARSNRARGTHAALGRRPRLGETREVRRRGALGRPDAPTQQQHDERGNRPAHCVRGEGGGGREAPQGSAAAVESAGPGSERPLGAPVLVPGGGSLPVITQRRDREARCRHRRPILGPPRAAAHTTAESLSSSSQ